ncbi:MAG: response regulator [Ignavibacteriae bacterium]|nr:response regulator [Ignavibacteriota bacterium]NOG99327.1 response regulator [Ignavibacteriota bacterium]
MVTPAIVLWSVLLGINLFVTFQHLFIGIKKKDSVHIYFALLSFCIGLSAFGMMMMVKTPEVKLSLAYYKLLYTTYGIATIFFVLFTQSFLNEKNKKIEKFFLIYFTVPLFLNIYLENGITLHTYDQLTTFKNIWGETFYTFIEQKNVRWTLVFYNILLYSAYSYSVYLCVKSWRKKNKTAKFLLLAYTIMFISTYFDILFFFGKGPILTASEFSYTIFIVIMSFNLAKNVIRSSAIQAESKRLKEVNELKSRFFANISHEFRTPLTLILGPVTTLLETAPQFNSELNLIQRNAIRLKQLINQLLDLSKLEAGKLNLQISETEIISHTKLLCSSFESIAKTKNISFNVNSNIEEQLVWVDRDKFDKIIFNLLNNGFKFTDNGGSISLQINKSHTNLNIIVKDSGVGINAKQLLNIFDRFYQADSGSSRKFGGSGIGLALVKELVDLHCGSITVESEPSKGSIFRISLPMDKSKLINAVELDEYSGYQSEKLNLVPEQLSPEKQKIHFKDQPLILITEDNLDVQTFLNSILRADYKLIFASNGKDGYKKVREQMPDLIISDVMMPVMDGIEFCNKLKNDIQTCHLPIIMLTAKASEESKLRGLRTGADSYLTKPFNADELKIRINNIFEKRKKLWEHFRKDVLIEPSNLTTTSMDEEFLARAIKVVNDNIDRFDFDTKKFAESLLISRAHLNRKIKGLTNLTPGEFIRSIKLKTAYQILSRKSATVTETAYQVGFNNLSYFTKCFKREFGTNPSEF